MQKFESQRFSLETSQRHTYVIFWKGWKTGAKGKSKRERERLKEKRRNFYV